MDGNPAVQRTYPFVGKRGWHVGLMLFIVIAPVVLLGFAFVGNWAGFGVRELVMIVLGHALAGIGISVGYHRMAAHGAFKAVAPARVLFMFLGGMSLQGGPATWAATHRRHHAVADQPGDPHSPLHGFWHAHFGWLPKGRLVTKGPSYQQLMQDPVVRFFERTQSFWAVMSILLPGLIGLAFWGTSAFWPAVIWGGFVRAGLLHHSTWAVNSIGHVWGTRPLDAPDQSRNNGLLAFVSFGEGWHNNHHAEPKSAYIGHRWYQWDLGKYVVWTCVRLGLIRDVTYPQRKQQRMARRAARRNSN